MCETAGLPTGSSASRVARIAFLSLRVPIVGSGTVPIIVEVLE